MANAKQRKDARTSSNSRPVQRTWIWLAAVAAAVLILGLAGVWLWLGGDQEQTGASQPFITSEQSTDGKTLYEANCASCHGIDGEGQPNWRVPNEQGVYPAPPHNNDGHTWHHPDQQLLDIIAAGGNLPNSAMPGFSGKLTQRQMEAVLAYIKTFWGPDELRFQNEVTQAREKQNQ